MTNVDILKKIKKKYEGYKNKCCNYLKNDQSYDNEFSI